MVMSDSYSMHVFKDSIKQIFTDVDENGHLNMGFCAKITTVCSKDFKVCGSVGCCCSLQKKHPHSISETEIGESGKPGRSNHPHFRT